MTQEKSTQNTIFDMSKIKANIEKKLGKNEIIGQGGQISEQKIQRTTESLKKDKKARKYVLTGISGFDELFENDLSLAKTYDFDGIGLLNQILSEYSQTGLEKDITQRFNKNNVPVEEEKGKKIKQKRKLEEDIKS